MKIIDNFLSMSLPWRVVLMLLMMFLAGPALIGLISEYATYWYAIKEGVRPPVEGIPYLSASVTFTSLVLALSVSLTFFLSRLVVGYLVGNVITSFGGYAQIPSLAVKFLKKFFEFDSNPFDKAFEQINSIPNEFKKIKPKIILLVTILASAITFGISYWQLHDNEQVIKFSIFISAYFVIIILTLWRKAVMQIVSFIIAIAFYVFSISLLFNHQYYSKFLSFTGFGGGESITIQLKDNEAPIEMKLILRSKDWFIGHSVINGESIEVPQHVVKNVRYTKTDKKAH